MHVVSHFERRRSKLARARRCEGIFVNVGIDGEISFIGFLSNPQRDITEVPLERLGCSQDSSRGHMVGIAPLQQTLPLVKMVALFVYQIDPEARAVQYYLVILREDFVTLEKLEKAVGGRWNQRTAAA